MHLSTQSFAVFVYPFAFDRGRFEALSRAVDADELSVGDRAWPVWARRHFPHDDLLRHVADYLNPPPGVPAAACLWSLSNQVLTSPKGLGLRRGSVRLWLRQRSGKVQGAEGPAGAGDGAIELSVAGADLYLFGVGMGYLIFRVRPGSELPDDWYDLLNGFRFIDRPQAVALLFERRTGKDSVEPFFPGLAECAECAASGRGVMRDLIQGLLRRLEPGGTDWWRELFVPAQMLPFHALFFVDAPEAEQPAVLYRLRNFFHAGQALVPSGDDLRTDHQALLPYADRMWFSLTLEGGGFVAFDAPETPFWTETMPSHLGDQYLLLFVLALHQRFTLMHLSDQVSARWLGGDDPEAEARFADLREALLEFTARGYFHQVMQREHHHRCFHAWQQVFETDRLYQEVVDEVRELHGILLMRKTERIQRLAEEQRALMDAQARADAERERAAQRRAEGIASWLGGIAFLLGFPSLVLAYLSVIGENDPGKTLIWAGTAALVGAAAMFLIHLWLRRDRNAKTGGTERPGEP